MILFKNNLYKLILILAVVSALAGCATQGTYFKIDPMLQRTAVNLDGAQYMPLAKICDAYGLDCRWDSLVKTAVIEKKNARIVVMAGSSTILVNGEARQLDRPVQLSGGAIFVPISFVKKEIGPVVGVAPVKVMPKQEGPKKFTIRTVVLDPGHGGKDAGATGRRYRTKEKDVALELALKIREILESGGIKVIMTRSDDTFIPLERRADIANRSSADLFVSVHINASRSRSLKGFECYFLSNATDDNARALEAFENSSLKLGEGATAEHSTQLDKTLWDMTLTENRLESAEIANHICDSVEHSLAVGNRGIRSARFYVLKYTNIPAVLVETAYISNRFEELKLRDPRFLDTMAEAVADGILKYKKDYERTEGYTNL